MSEKLIGTELSTKELTFQPGYGVAQFEINVVNYSDRFASFQLDITAAGGDPSSERTWYSLSPEVSTKKPPGDTTTFIVEIQKTPILGFVGLINLTVQIFSLELGVEERHILRLRVEKGIGELVITAQLPNSHLQGYPNTDLEIPLRLYNPSQKEVPAAIALRSSTPWLSLPTASVNLPAGQWIDHKLTCALPDIDRAIAGNDYLSQIKISHPEGPPTKLEARIEILPQGQILFEAPTPSHTLPRKRRWLPFFFRGLGTWKTPAVIYPLILENQSNQNYQATINLPLPEKKKSAPILELLPPENTLPPTQTQTFDLRVAIARPWWGWVVEKSILVEAKLTPKALQSDRPKPPELELPRNHPFSQPPLVNGKQTLTLQLFPIIPRWLQGLLALFLVWIFWWLLYGQYYHIKHQGAVNTVQFNGLADRILSGGVDQQVQDWVVENKRLEFIRVRAQADKAVRTVKYRPVDNNEMVMGLENGEIQLWDLLSDLDTPLQIFAYQKDDRVMDLEFTPDSRYLFSGHGSGLVAQWYVGPEVGEPDNLNQPRLTKTFEFAISDIAFVGKNTETLAIAGRYNQLILWNILENSTRSLQISQSAPTSQDNYITSLATAEQRPFLLAVADNQGGISIWNLRSCLDPSALSDGGTNLSCELLDRWENGHENKAVRAIALSADGSYLASVGDDGRAILWPLRESGQRLTKYLNGKAIGKQNDPLNSVDLSLIPSWKEKTGTLIQMVTGGDDGQVRLYQIKSLQ